MWLDQAEQIARQMGMELSCSTRRPVPAGQI
jgi:hypothetical protein